MIQVRSINGAFAEVIGDVSLDDAPLLQSALLDHHLLLFRGRTLEPAEQIRLTRCFGSKLHGASPRLRFLPEHPEIFRMSNREEVGNLNNGCYWHCDGQDVPDPAAVSVHHIIKTTPDSLTRYVDTTRAWRELSQMARFRLSRTICRTKSGLHHPLCIAHPVTGEMAIYPNLDPLACITPTSGFPPSAQAGEIMAQLDSLAYAHHWRKGDLIIIDNFAVAHCAQPADPKELRVLNRTTVPADSAWWRRR